MQTVTRIFEFDAALLCLLEEWKDLKGYEGLYKISSCGRVMSLERDLSLTKNSNRYSFFNRSVGNRILKPSYNKDGYAHVILYRNGRIKRYRVHRLVAEAFIPNKDNLLYVNHKNYDRSDNRVSNLEWCTAEYNLSYSNVLEKSNESCQKRVKQELNGKLVRIWNSISEASRGIKGDETLTGNIAYCCKGKRNSCMGFNWSYC